MKEFSRRGFLQGVSLAAAARPQAAVAQGAAYRHRTQFDAQLLAESSDPLVAANHGRQMRELPGGRVQTALAWGGTKPRVRVYEDRKPARDYPLEGVPSAPVMAGEHVFYSAGTTLYQDGKPLSGAYGRLLDAVAAPDGGVVLALERAGQLELQGLANAGKPVAVDEVAGRASLEFDPAGLLHIAYEKRQGIEYRVYRGGVLQHGERAAEAYGFHPVLLAHDGAIVLA